MTGEYGGFGTATPSGWSAWRGMGLPTSFAFVDAGTLESPRHERSVDCRVLRPRAHGPADGTQPRSRRVRRPRLEPLAARGRVDRRHSAGRLVRGSRAGRRPAADAL